MPRKDRIKREEKKNTKKRKRKREVIKGGEIENEGRNKHREGRKRRKEKGKV